MKYSYIKLFGLILFGIIGTTATAQFKPSKKFGKLMKEVQVGISILDQKYFNENFSTTNENPLERNDISYSYQLSGKHNSLPIHFTLSLDPKKNINVDHRVKSTSIAVGISSGHEVKQYSDEMLNYMGAKRISYIHAGLSFDALEGDYFNTASDANKGKYFKYDLAFVFGMNSENGYLELVIYHNKANDLKNEVNEAINRILTSFMFKEPLANAKDFAGVGVAIGQNSKYSHYQITAVVQGGSSYMAGILPGDFIIQVDNQLVDDKDMSRLVGLIRGEVGTKVEILVQRGTILFSYNLTRKKMDLSVDVIMKKRKDYDLSKIYFLNTTAYILGNDLISDDYEDFIENVDEGKKYKYYLDFPMSTPGTIIKTSKNSRIEYILYSTKEEEKVKVFYDKLKGYILDEYTTGKPLKPQDEGNVISLRSPLIPGKVFAELSFTSTSSGFYTVKYVFYK